MPKTPVQLIKELFDADQLEDKFTLSQGGDVIETKDRTFEIIREAFTVKVKITEGGSVQTVACDNEIKNVAQSFFTRAAIKSDQKPAPVTKKPVTKLPAEPPAKAKKRGRPKKAK